MAYFQVLLDGPMLNFHDYGRKGTSATSSHGCLVSKVQSAGLAKWKGVRLLLLWMKKAWQPILRLCFFSGTYSLHVNKYMWMCVCLIRGSIRTSSSNPPYCSMKPGNQMFQPTQITKWRFLICSIMMWGPKTHTLPETTVPTPPWKFDAWKMNFL